MTDDGRPLLEQAEAAGLTPESGCRMGICHSCTRRKTSGAVRNLITGAVSSAEEEDVQICVSVPVGDVDIALYGKENHDYTDHHRSRRHFRRPSPARPSR